MSPDHACFRYLAGTEKVPMDRLVCFTLFQTLLGEDGNDTAFCFVLPGAILPQLMI